MAALNLRQQQQGRDASQKHERGRKPWKETCMQRDVTHKPDVRDRVSGKQAQRIDEVRIDGVVTPKLNNALR